MRRDKAERYAAVVAVAVIVLVIVAVNAGLLALGTWVVKSVWGG